MNLRLMLLLLVLVPPFSFGQNWKQVHKTDEEKWARTTGLDPSTIHKLWRSASSVSEEKDDDSRIANIDLDGLAERHDLLLVTYAGENNCLTMTVFRQFSQSKFDKVWSAERAPDGTRFCDSGLGNARSYAENGAVLVRVPPSGQSAPDYVLYRYEWNGITYRLADKKDLQGGDSRPN